MSLLAIVVQTKNNFNGSEKWHCNATELIFIKCANKVVTNNIEGEASATEKQVFQSAILRDLVSLWMFCTFLDTAFCHSRAVGRSENMQESLSLQSFWFEKLYSLDTILSTSRLLDAAINMWWWHTINVSDTLSMIHQLSVCRVKIQSKLLWSRMMKGLKIQACHIKIAACYLFSWIVQLHGLVSYFKVEYGGFHLHLIFPFLYQFNSRIGVLVHSSFSND